MAEQSRPGTRQRKHSFISSIRSGRSWISFGRRLSKGESISDESVKQPSAPVEVNAGRRRKLWAGPIERRARVRTDTGTSREALAPRPSTGSSLSRRSLHEFVEDNALRAHEPRGSKARLMEDFYRHIADVHDSITLVDHHVKSISRLHATVLDNPDPRSSQIADQELTDVQNLTRSLLNACKHKLLSMHRTANMLAAGGDKTVQLNQIVGARDRLKACVLVYHEMESRYRLRYRDLAERQFRIVYPTATREEIRAVIDGAPAGDAIFRRALRRSSRSGEAALAMREVQDRHRDIQRVEKNIDELSVLYDDLDVLLLDQVEEAAGANGKALHVVHQEVKEAEKQLALGATRARKAKKRTWCILLACVILLFGAGIVLTTVLCLTGHCSVKRAGSDAAAPAAEDTPATTSSSSPSATSTEAASATSGPAAEATATSVEATAPATSTSAPVPTATASVSASGSASASTASAASSAPTASAAAATPSSTAAVTAPRGTGAVVVIIPPVGTQQGKRVGEDPDLLLEVPLFDPFHFGDEEEWWTPYIDPSMAGILSQGGINLGGPKDCSTTRADGTPADCAKWKTGQGRAAMKVLIPPAAPREHHGSKQWKTEGRTQGQPSKQQHRHRQPLDYSALDEPYLSKSIKPRSLRHGFAPDDAYFDPRDDEML